jgi:hypothetical protein
VLFEYSVPRNRQLILTVSDEIKFVNFQEVN